MQRGVKDILKWNWVDILCLLIFIKGSLDGFTRGFILSAFKTAGVLVSLYVGIFYRDTVVEFIRSNFALESSISAMFPVTGDPAGTGEVLEVLGLGSVVDMIMGAIGFFLVFIAVQLAFLVLAYFLEGIIRFSHLTFMNRLAGFGFGLARSVLWIALTSAVLSPFLSIWPQNFLSRGMGGSYILTHLKFLDIITPVVVKFI